MTEITTDFTTAPALRTRLAHIATRIATRTAKAFERMTEAQSRSGQIEALQALSDAELARLGLRRDDIPRYVFRDLFYT